MAFGRPVVFVENFYSVIQFPSHTVAVTENPSANPKERLANARRRAADHWTMTTANTLANIDVTCDRVRGADCIVLDRGHNLSGEAIKLVGSSDNFTTSEDILDLTIPSVSSPGGLDDPLGVISEEGAWLKRFDLRAFKYFRFQIAAMGVGNRPIVVGLQLGLSFESRLYDLPWDDDAGELLGGSSESSIGWRGRALANVRRRGTIGIRLEDAIQYDQARYNILGHARRGRPMWIVYDQNQAANAVLAQLDEGVHGFRMGRDWWDKRRADVPWVEHEPLLE